MLPAEVPVLIVGAGPSGTMAALLLEQLGVETLQVERRSGPQYAPAAHVVNARTFEICRQAGVDRKTVAAACQDPADAGYAYWVTKLGGRALGRLPFECQGDDQLAVTPTPLRNLSQNLFEPILLGTLASNCGKAPHFRHQWQAAEQDGDRVRSRILDLESGQEHEVTSRYLLAADGAGSRVRKSLGIEVVGPASIQSFVMVHFFANLRPLADDPPGVLFFVCDPAAGGGVFVVHDLERESVFMHPYDPENESVDDYDKERCAELVRDALEDPNFELTVETISPWVMTAQVAERYRDGNIFLVGDSAHRFPPTGGLGLNSGVQDVHNLAWKLAAVEKGWAPAPLLDSYEVERRPVAQNNADQSLRNALKLFEVAQALGITDLSDASRQRMEATLADPEGRKRIDAAIANQAEHFDMPGLQLGFAYAEGAVIPEAGEAPGFKDARRFVPSGAPGCRLPHTWAQSESGARESLLDWVSLDRFLLLAGPDGAAWIDAANSIEGVPLEARQLSEAQIPELDTWLSQAGIGRDGALLVRPDQHVAWRARTVADEPDPALSQALKRTLQ